MQTNSIPIIYINLEKRIDRRQHMEQQFEKYEIREAERFNAIENPGFGIWGCGMSHLAVLRLAKERNYPYIWIMEDDFIFEIGPEELKEQIESLVLTEEFQQCDVFMAAYNLKESEPLSKPLTAKYGRALFAQTASCYIVKSHYYQKLIDLYEDTMPKLKETGQHWIYANDIVWANFQKSDRWIYPLKRWGKQMDGYSDNAQQVMSYNC